MSVDKDLALERALEQGDDWGSWRALRLSGDDPGEIPVVPGQGADGSFIGDGDTPSPGATGWELCHLVVLGCTTSPPAAGAVAWLRHSMTPARAWLDSPENVPGVLDTPAAARVWGTAAAACGLMAAGRDPGSRAIDLLRGEADQDGRFTGGAYPTFAAAGAYWLAEGPKTEMAEWALRWSREWREEWWGPWELATGLTFWGAADIPLEHPTVDSFLDELRDGAPAAGWESDLDLTILTLELLDHFGA
ncbi:MAG: hypothetical protein ACRDJV_14540 [Actinomycetota bacterium]